MSRPRSAGSVFWGLILISIGLIFLLKNLGVDIPIWQGIATYWPLLLILWGIIKLIDYVRWRRAGEPGPLFGAGEVVLLIIVILCGAALTAAANLSTDFGSLFEIADIDLWGNSYSYPEHYEMNVPAGSAIEVINRYGNVELMPADTDIIIVDVEKTVRAANKTNADQLSTALTFSIAEQGGSYRITSNRENIARGRRIRTSLTVKVPKSSPVTVRNAFGQVSLKGINGAVQVVNRNDMVVVEDIMGATKITNEFARIEVRRVTGTVEIENRNGNVDVDEIKGDTSIDNSFDSIDVRNVQGSLSINARMAEIHVMNIENNVTVQNRFNSVQIENARGEVSVENQHGSVELRYEQPPRNNIRVHSRFGDVTLMLPEDSAFSIDARTRFGSVESDFAELAQQEDRERNSLTGRVGVSGPEIRIDNQNANIRIENR
jgi:hypothetical protein